MKQLFLTGIFLAFFISLLGAATIDVRIASSSDDAVEEISSSNVYLDEGQLDIVVYPSGDIPQKVGLRFINLQIPNGATINNAYIQFRATQDEIGQTDITIVGENSSNPLTYAAVSNNITGRTETSNSIDWLNVQAWTGDQDYKTVDITSVIQELVDLGGWQAGNAMAIMMKPYDANCKDAECLRMAVSFDGDSTVAPLLHIVFNELPTPPQMGDVPDSQTDVDLSFTLSISDYVTVTDGDPILGYTLTGTLPSGLEFDSVTGIISGIPRLIESQTLSITATDKDGTSTSDSFTITVTNSLVINYRMDECYWLGSAYKDVMDSSFNGLNGTSYNNAVIDKVNFQINSSGLFDGAGDYIDIDDDPKLQFTDKMTVSLWVYPKRDNQDEYYIAKRAGTQGWYLWFDNRKTDRIEFSLRINNGWRDIRINKPNNWINNWHFITVTYDGSQMKMFIDNLSATTARTGVITHSSNPMVLGQYNNGKYFQGNIDEVKIWNTALSTAEINSIYANELLKKNYNGTVRDEVVCSTSIVANSWEMIGIPAESRISSIGVQDVFGDDFVGANYDAGDVNGWILWKRVFSDNNNSAEWLKVDYANNEAIEFGKGYWLGSTVSGTWDVDGLEAVDYNSAYNGTANCVSKRCVEIDLRSVSSDGTDGTGSKRYNMSGFVGETPVNWRDCRFIVSDLDGSNVEVLTPEEAETAGYASRTISLWPGGQGTGAGGQVLSTDYTECTDTSPGECELVPYHGAWIEVFVPTLTKTVKLLIPQE